MKDLIILADTHIGNVQQLGGEMISGLNDRCRATLNSLYQVLCRYPHKHVVVCGDFFDTCNPSPPVVAATMDILKNIGKQFFILPGNHDTASDDHGDNALGPLKALPNVRVINHPTVAMIDGEEYWFIPYRSHLGDEYIPQAMAGMATPGEKSSHLSISGKPEAVFFHAGIRDKATPPWLMNAKDSIDLQKLLFCMNKYSVNYAFAGNWHQHRAWEARRVCQVGAFHPNTFPPLPEGEEMSKDVGVLLLANDAIILQTGTLAMSTIRLSLAKEPAKNPNGFVRLLYSAGREAEARAVLDKWLDSSHFQAGRIELEESEDLETPQLQLPTMSEDWIERNILEWVAAQQFDNPSEVAGEVRKYLNDARKVP